MSVSDSSGADRRRTRLLYTTVLIAIAIGILLGVIAPSTAAKMKPFGDGFIKLIKMTIAPLIFCTVVVGIAGMKSMKEVGRAGGLAILYFEIMTTVALVIGLVVVNVVQPGVGMNIDPKKLDTSGIAQYVGAAAGAASAASPGGAPAASPGGSAAPGTGAAPAAGATGGSAAPGTGAAPAAGTTGGSAAPGTGAAPAAGSAAAAGAAAGGTAGTAPGGSAGAASATAGGSAIAADTGTGGSAGSAAAPGGAASGSTAGGSGGDAKPKPATAGGDAKPKPAGAAGGDAKPKPATAGGDAKPKLTFEGFLLDIIPDAFVGAFTKGDLLPVLLLAVLFGFALHRTGDRGKPILDLVDRFGHVIFGVVRIIMFLAPLGAFGGMAFTVGQYGIRTLASLGALMTCFYLTCLLFVFVVLGTVARFAGFSIFRFVRYIRDELFIVLGTSSSETVLPRMITRLESLGASKPVVGLVIPAGYSFNLDGTSIYLTMAAVFIAQATNTPLDVWHQLELLAVLLLTSKGAAGVTGSGFIVLAATIGAVGNVPVAGLALIVGIDRFMSEARSLTNLVGNGVATLVVARWCNEIDDVRLREGLAGPPPEDLAQLPASTAN